MGETLSKENEKFERLDGAIQYVSWEVKPWYKENNTIGGIVLTTIDSTDKIKSKELKQEISLDLLNKAFIATDDGIWDWNVVENSVYYSPRWKAMLGYTNDEIKNDFLGWEKLMHPDDLEYAKAEALSLANGEISNISAEFRMLCKDGTYKWILSRSKVVEVNKNNKPIRLVGTHTDIQSKKENEKKLKEQNDKLTTLKSNLDNAIEIATLGIWEWDAINDILIWSDIVYDIYGVDKKTQLSVKLIETIIYKDDLELHQQQINSYTSEKESIYFEYRIVKDEEIRTISAIGKPIIENDKLVKMTGVVQDITDLKRKEKNLLEAQKIAKLGSYDFNIANNSFICSLVIDDIFGVPQDYNKTFETWSELIHEDDKEMMQNYFMQIIKDKDNFDKEYRIRDFKTNAIKWVHGLGVIKFDIKDNPYRLFGTLQDITQRKVIETQMKQALTVFENTHDSIMITNSNNEIINVNNSFINTTGYSLEEVIEENPSILKSFIYKEDFYKKMWESIKIKGFWQGEITNKRKNGELYEAYLTISAVKNNNGSIESYIGIFSDITIIKNQEKMILQQSRSSAIGEMIGNIAHQWRQPLSVISTAATGVKLQLSLDTMQKEEIITYMDRINEQSQYLSKTIEDFRSFFTEDLSIITEFKIEEAINKLDNLTNDAFNNNFTELIYDIDEDIYILGNKNLLIQALLNIYNNALDALKTKSSKERRLIFIKVKKEDSKVNIYIKDNAHGIRKEFIEKIFDPYFTTKHQSQGTGIGLYMTHQIVIKHLKGTIKVSNVQYKYEEKSYSGAEFIISMEDTM